MYKEHITAPIKPTATCTAQTHTYMIFKTRVLFRLVSTELLEGDFYTCANTKERH